MLLWTRSIVDWLCFRSSVRIEPTVIAVTAESERFNPSEAVVRQLVKRNKLV